MPFKKSAGILAIGLLAVGLILTGNMACSKKAAESGTPAGGEAAASVPQEMNIKEGLNDIEGTVKSALGKYFYIVQMPGFDIAVNGNFDAASLIDKDVKVKAEFTRETPSILMAQSIEVKEGAVLKNVYTSADKSIPQDYFAQKTRPEYAALKITAIAKSADWEGKGKGKVRGKFIPGAEGKPAQIAVLGDKDAEVARIIVDSSSEYASYYLKKMRIFDTFWFYITIKDSVPANQRAKAKEIFHADVLFAGLY